MVNGSDFIIVPMILKIGTVKESKKGVVIGFVVQPVVELMMS